MPRTSHPDRVVVPTRGDPVAAAASEVIGGPLGRYAVAVAKGWRYYAAVLGAASAIPMGLAVLERSHCIVSGWATPDQFWHACFSDLPATYKDNGLAAGLGPFLSGGFSSPTVAQPPLTGFVMTLLAEVVPSGDIGSRMLWYFALWAGLAAVLLVLTVWWTTASVRLFPIRGAHIALSPVVVLTIVVAPDILGVALLAAGLYFWSRERLVLSGVLLGLAISARTYPLLILVALLLVCLRAGRLLVWARVAGTALVTFGAILTGLGLLNPDAAFLAYRSWATGGAGFGSPWVLPQLAGYPLPSTAVTGLAIVGIAVAVVAGAVFALGAPRRPGVAEVSLVMVAIVLVTGKSMPVQSSLWLVPLVALVGLRWKDHLIWAGAEALYFIGVWLYIAAISVPDRGLPPGWYAAFLLIRLLGVGWLVHRTWHVAQRRWPDVRETALERRTAAEESGHPLDGEALAELEETDARLAREGDPDELAGPIRGCPDQLIVRFG